MPGRWTLVNHKTGTEPFSGSEGDTKAQYHRAITNGVPATDLYVEDGAGHCYVWSTRIRRWVVTTTGASSQSSALANDKGGHD